MGHVDFQAAFIAAPVDDFGHFAHDFGANTVPGEDKK
jgi:hypothetical protein